MLTQQVLLLTDLVDSTKLVERLGDLDAAVWWEAHDRQARVLMRAWRGREIDKSDGFLLIFDTVSDAVGYALAYNASTRALDPPQAARIGVHCGQVVVRANRAEDIAQGAKQHEVDGIAKSIAARVMNLALGGQILLSAPARAALDIGGWPLRSQGHWKLKGVEEPIELFELGGDGASYEPPPDSAKAYRVLRDDPQSWRPVRELPHNLPADRDAFIGRREALRALAGRFDDGARLVTLLGIGGIGKTRLALRYGRAWVGEYQGGAWFCDLSAARNLDGIVQAVAQALEVPLGKSDPIPLLGAAIAGRGPCLVIVDNFEQVARHAEATLGAWLDRAPQARFIVTSREVLGIVGEEAMVLAPLGDDEALQLFDKRARAADSEWAPAADDRHHLHTLVELLDRLPLAIELAAARIRVMSPKAMLDRMGQRFELLASSGGRRDRQATLQATLDWSWDMLTPAEQSALAQLSVFEGGFTLDAAEAVVSFVGLDEAHRTANVLQNLVQKSLLRRSTVDRFDMLRAVHDYATAKCAFVPVESEARTWAAAERRHWHYFAMQDDPISVGHYDVDLDNLFAACRRAAPSDPSHAARLLTAIWSRIKWTGPFGAVLDLAQAIRTSTATDSEQRGMVDETAGEAHALLGNRLTAYELLASALQRAVVHDDELAQARIDCELVGLEPEEGALDTARERLSAALSIAERLNNASVCMRAMNAMARVLMAHSQMREAEQWYLRALELASSRQDGRWLGGLHGNLGTLHHALGRLESARAHYEHSLALSRVAGNRQWEGNMRCNFGLLLNELGKPQAALAELHAALELARSIGHMRLEATTQCNLGIVHEAAGQTDAALSCYSQAVETVQRMASPVVEGQLRGYLAAALARSGRLDEAESCIASAAERCKASNDPATRALLVSQQALVSALSGRHDDSIAYLAEAERWLGLADGDAGTDCKSVIDEVRARLGER